jgi:hypothetical protein
MATTEVPPGKPAAQPQLTAEERRKRRRRAVLRRRMVGLALVAAAVATAVLVAGARLAAPDLRLAGPDDGAVLGPQALGGLAFTATTGDPVAVRWAIDGADATAAAVVSGGTSVLRPSGLADGEHVIEARVGDRFPFASRSVSLRIVVDTAPPAIEPRAARIETTPLEPVALRGVVEPGATLRVNGQAARVAPDGSFAVRFPRPPSQIVLEASDRAGNRASAAVPVALVPRRPPEPVRGVHVSALGWANGELRAAVLDMVDRGLITTVEIDLKDESGEIGYDSRVPLGREIGAVKAHYDLQEAVELLHGKGVHVIGRLVAFRDPILARAAWDRGHRDQVIQTPAGEPYAGYGGFTNFAHPVVQQYNIDVAVEAARAGVDDILYDYVRRPDGPLSSMVFPGIEGRAPEKVVAAFLRETREALAPTKAYLGASVFGIAATRPHEIGQSIPAIARHVDYVAPMLYPSHWGPYEYRLANPNAEPYEIVKRSLPDFIAAVEGKGARVVPWLQDFSLGLEYGTDEVRAQIEATLDAGIDEFLLWDPEVTYHAAALRAIEDRR